MQTIGDRIKQLRQAHSLTQSDLAKRAGLQRGNVSHYELNKVRPSASAIMQLASFFGVSSDWLLTGKEPVNHGQPDQLLDYAVTDERELIEEFLAYRRTRATASPVADKQPFAPVVREGLEAYLPLFGQAETGQSLLPRQSFQGFVRVPDVSDQSEVIALRWPIRCDQSASPSLGILLVKCDGLVQPDELVLATNDDRLVVGRVSPDGVYLWPERVSQEQLPLELACLVVIGRVMAVQPSGTEGVHSPLFFGL